jgi:hypothetical protein
MLPTSAALLALAEGAEEQFSSPDARGALHPRETLTGENLMSD